MSKIAEKKATEIAYKRESFKYDDTHYQIGLYDGAIEGYDQAMQDFLEKACDWLEKQFNMPNDFRQHFCKAMEK